MPIRSELIAAYKYLIMLMLCVVIVDSLPAQSRLELLHADFSRGELRGAQPVRILEGNVHIRQDSVEIHCDKAAYFPLLRKVELTGEVNIIRGTENLTARKVTYYEDRKVAIAEGDVHTWQKGRQLFADYLEHYYETDRVFARGHVRILDPSRRLTVTAARGEFDRQQNRSYVEKGAHLWQVDSTGVDTLHIYARRLSYGFSNDRVAIARDSVKIIYQNLTATCDSAIYFIDEEKAYLRIHPRARQDQNFLSGTEMELLLHNLNVHQINVQGQAKALSHPVDNPKEENRLEGKRIIMKIEQRKLKELWAINNASSYYHLQDQNEAQGINEATADTIRVYFKNSELDSISVIGGSQGTYFPADYQKPPREKKNDQRPR